jgi:hypothetical protein
MLILKLCNVLLPIFYLNRNQSKIQGITLDKFYVLTEILQHFTPHLFYTIQAG